MRQFQFAYTDRMDFDNRLAAYVKDRRKKALFKIYCARSADSQVKEICRAIKARFPRAVIAGCSTFGTIVSGSFQEDSVVVSGMLFDDETTQIEALYFPLETGEAVHIGHLVVSEVAKRPWVKAVEVFIMNNGQMLDDFREALDRLPKDVAVFGGKSDFGHDPDVQTFVIAEDGSCMRWGASFVFYGGDNLHFMTKSIGGWRPLGLEVSVTRYTGNVIHEVNGVAAIELYSHFLGVENDANFYYNAIDFPLLFKDGKSTIVRTPFACLDDGSIVLASSFPGGGRFRMSYGDPEEFLRESREFGEEVARFRPDGIVLVSSAARRTFWSDRGSNRETVAFNSVAPTVGCFAAGELLRENGKVVEHNSTLIVVAIREGSQADKPQAFFGAQEERRKKSLMARLAKLVNVTMDDCNRALTALGEANKRIEELTDGKESGPSI